MQASTRGQTQAEARSHEASADSRRGRLGEILEQLGVVRATDVLLGAYEQELGDTRRLGEILVAQGAATPEQIEVALEIQRGARTMDSVHLDRWSRATVPRGPAAIGLGSAEALRVANPRIRVARNVQTLLMFIVAVVVFGLIASHNGPGGWYGVGALSLLTLKQIGSVLYRPSSAPLQSGVRVALVVCVYNEDPRAFLVCLESVLAQTRLPDEIWVIDDGSDNDTCARLAQEMLKDTVDGRVRRLPVNVGKRHAQGVVFRETTCDIVVTIDSDTVLDPAAVAEGLRPFADRRVQAVTGNVRALNHRTNLLTRLIDLRYANAFLFERGAYSTLGSVVCCCGSFSLYRSSVLKENLFDFLDQTFLGVPVQYGDDRRLTQYALKAGRVHLQDSAVAYTLVPERLGHFRRQQLRWNKSFFRESLWALRRFGPRRWPFWMSLVELTVWFAFSVSLMTVIYVRPIVTGHLIPWEYVAFAVVLAYARNVRYFGRPGDRLRTQLATFALSPLYPLLHVVLLTPLRIQALLTLRSTGWGTRSNVEVRAAQDVSSQVW